MTKKARQAAEADARRRCRVLRNFGVANLSEAFDRFMACNTVMERDNLQKAIIKNRLWG